MKRNRQGKLRGLMLGAGYFANIQLEAWKLVQGAEIAGILDISKDKAERLAKKHGVPYYNTDWELAVKAVKPDFIDICTHPDSHLHYARLSVDLGLPVLCQKPVATSLKESEELISLFSEKKIPLMINDNWRWQVWYREMKRLIEAGMLGQVYTVYAAMRPGDGWGEQPYPLQPYFRTMEKFLIYETGVHYIDTFRYLFGEITSVYCQIRTVNSLIRGEDLAVIHFNFENGMIGIYDANRTTYTEHIRCPTYGYMTVEGTEGSLRLDENGRLFIKPRNGKEYEHHYFIPDFGWKGGSTVYCQQHFVDGLLFNKPFETSGQNYIKTVRVVYACYESAKNNTVVLC